MKGKINIMVIGSGNDSTAVIKALEEIHRKHDCDVALSNDGDIELVQSEPLTETQMPKCSWGKVKPKPQNKWRGGSRGKGGKTKWSRR